jgi:hypothetical protein
VDPSWAANNTPINFGMWATGFDGSSVSAFPIIAYLNNDYDTADSANGDPTAGYTTPGFYIYDYNGLFNSNGDWVLVAAANAGVFNTISFTLTVGTGFEYYVNGVPVYSYADAFTDSLGNVILDANNFGGDYTAYLAGFSATSAPLPASVWGGSALFTAMGIVTLVGKRRRMMAI